MSLAGSTGSIVVGVDGSSGARAALCWAIGEAQFRRIPVHAVYVHKHPWSSDTASPYRQLVVGELRERLAEEARQNLDDEVHAALETAGDGVRVVQQVVEGFPAEVLVRAATDADLLVVGSRGHGGFVGLLLGSVSQQCAQHASCPVVIVPPAAAAESATLPCTSEALPRDSTLRVRRLRGNGAWAADVRGPGGEWVGHALEADRDTAIERATTEAARLAAAQSGYHPERE
ncbi:MAG: universal stress protein [Gaiellaceae bacterium]